MFVRQCPGIERCFCINQINAAPHCFYHYYFFLNQQSITMIERVNKKNNYHAPSFLSCWFHIHKPAIC